MYEVFKQILGAENVLIDEPMSKHTSFKIGGNADFLLTPETEEQLKAVLMAAKENGLPTFIMGNGSNLLVGDKGIRGAVISLCKKMNMIEVKGEKIYAGCGALLSRTSAEALKVELEGLEFASGIPGTVGGGIYMNAGAYGSEMKDVVESVRYMDNEGNISEIGVDLCKFGYRKSVFAENGYIILGATFKLKKGSHDEIRKKINDFTNRRVTKQPIERPSAGSVFKRPEGYFAGTLIDEAGLKGYSVGGAEVSEKHAGFIINKGDATAKDVLELIEHIQEVVYKKNGVRLETEVKLVGEL